MNRAANCHYTRVLAYAESCAFLGIFYFFSPRQLYYLVLALQVNLLINQYYIGR